MPTELTNKKDCYPFAVTQQQLTASQLAVVQTIGAIQLCVCVASEVPVKVHLKQVAATYIVFDIQGQSITADLFGNVAQAGQSADIKLIRENSYVIYDNPPENGQFEVSIRGTYNLPLLQQVLMYVPKGLQITCVKHPLQAKAHRVPANQGTKVVYKDTIKFIQGYNCSIQTQGSSIIMAAGASLGQGIVPNSIIKQLLGYQSVPQAVTYKGLRYINSIYPSVTLQTSSGLQAKVQSIQGTDSVSVKLAVRGQR